MNSQVEPGTSVPDKKLSRAFEVLETLLLIVVLAAALLTATRAWYRMHWPFQMDYAEGTILNSAWRLAQGGVLYPPLGGMPYQIDPYPPFIYYLVGLAMKHGGIDFFYPRLLAFVAAVIACLLATILIHHWLSRWKLALTFGFLPLTIAVVQAWLGVVRYDFVGVALTMAGLVIFVLFPKYRLLSLPFFALAVAGLYTLVAAPSACCLYLWIRREKKNSIFLGACFAALLTSGFLYAQHASSGLIVYHLFRTQHSPYSLSQLASFGQMFLRGYALLFLLSAAIVWKAIREKRIDFVLLYWGLVGATSLSLGKIGAAQNHILQLVFAICITSAVAYDWIRRNSPHDWGLALVLSSLILITMTNVPLRPKKPIEELSGCGEAYAAVQSGLGDRILSDNVGALILAGKPVFVSDPFVFRWLVTGAGFSDRDLLQTINSGEFTSIVLNSRVEGDISNDDRWPEDVRQVIRQNYRLTREFNCNDAKFAYVPKASTPPSEQGFSHAEPSAVDQTRSDQ